MSKARHLGRLVTSWQHRGSKYSTATKTPQTVTILPDSTLATFRTRALQKAVPALLPRGHFNTLPAVHKWFSKSVEHGNDDARLDNYLDKFGDAIVPLEITDDGRFVQVQETLQFFISASTATNLSTRVYLAQASLADLPEAMREDVPTPDLVLSAGKGDIYDTSIWLGRAPTYTPLHRDPNPNLFVQLAGSKRVRLFRPELGAAIFHHVQTSIGGTASATMRGAEMMEGAERMALEQAVWGDGDDTQWPAHGLECEVGPGDGLFIPKGWWHSIKGIGQGTTGSVNWWFR